MLGREVTLAAPPARIVSLVPSVTEILFALGAEDRLVGVTDFCDYPPAARRKPRVGGMLTPSLEVIAALRPDLVVATTEGNREETFAPLRRALPALGPEPLIGPGRESLVTELIARAGGRSITAAEGSDYPRFGLEAAVARAPEVVLLANHSASAGPIDRERWRGLTSVPAIRAGRLHAVDGDLLHRYGPRVVAGPQ